jgi:hypothetical protein
VSCARADFAAAAADADPFFEDAPDLLLDAPEAFELGDDAGLLAGFGLAAFVLGGFGTAAGSGGAAAGAEAVGAADAGALGVRTTPMTPATIAASGKLRRLLDPIRRVFPLHQPRVKFAVSALRHCVKTVRLSIA